LVALSPDVVLATAGSIVGAFQQASRTVPIVFVTTIDPVGGGWVESLSRPGSNATGFAAFEFSMSGKWLELLKEIAPWVKRVAVIRDPSVPAGSGGLAAIQTVAPSFGVELTPVGVRTTDETSPPSETAPDLADFSSATRSRSTFRGKRAGNCTWSMPDGTIRRSFTRTVAGKLAGRGSVAPTPCRGER
jgi:ABC-type uncharacterized transport system substrate-binding protein